MVQRANILTHILLNLGLAAGKIRAGRARLHPYSSSTSAFSARSLVRAPRPEIALLGILAVTAGN